MKTDSLTAESHALWQTDPAARRTRLDDLFVREPELLRAMLEGIERESDETIRTVLDAAQQALERHPDYADLLYYSAQAASMVGDDATAELLLDKALQVNPRYSDALILAARVALNLAKPERAETLLRQAIAAGADYPDVHVLLGDARRQKGCFAQARNAYEHALALNGGLASAQLALESLPPR